MLTILLLATVVQILAKSRDSPFILKDPAKSLKKHIADPIRRDIVIALVNEAKGKYRKYKKRTNAYAKVLAVLTSDPSTSKDELNAIFEAMLAGIYHDQEARILGRVKGLDFITEKEFYAIINESISRRNEMHIENNKKWMKIDDSFSKSLKKLSRIIKQVITEHKKQEHVLETIEQYKTAMRTMISQIATWNYKDNVILRNYHATEEELLQTIADLNQHRRKIYDLLIELYSQLCSTLNEKEWNSIKKAMKRIL